MVKVIVNWISKSLLGSGLGVILRSLRNSPFVHQDRRTDRIYRQPSGSYALFKLWLLGYARAKERTQVLRSLQITPSPQVKPFRAIFLRQVRKMTRHMSPHWHSPVYIFICILWLKTWIQN